MTEFVVRDDTPHDHGIQVQLIMRFLDLDWPCYNGDASLLNFNCFKANIITIVFIHMFPFSL